MESIGPDIAKREELADFLKSRRARLQPEDVGLSEGARRRTPGLRREEVALLAGVGATWYTWLEQGREVNPSYGVLWSLARALQLNGAECNYMFYLAGRPMRDKHKQPLNSQQPGEPLQRMLRRLTNQPAYILGPRWDILAWNQAASALFGDYAELHGDERNIISMLFNNPSHRSLLTDWAELAPTALSLFRAESAHLAGEPDRERLISSLLRESPEFRYWWGKHDISLYASNYKRIQHPLVGYMLFEHNSFTSDDGSKTKLVMYTPLLEEGTLEKMELLLKSANQQET